MFLLVNMLRAIVNWRLAKVSALGEASRGVPLRFPACAGFLQPQPLLAALESKVSFLSFIAV